LTDCTDSCIARRRRETPHGVNRAEIANQTGNSGGGAVARLDQARQLLAVSEYSVTDICMEVGFSSLGSFSSLFARRFGEAPSKYRRQIRLKSFAGWVAVGFERQVEVNMASQPENSTRCF